jgi:hypothetical protein
MICLCLWFTADYTVQHGSFEQLVRYATGSVEIATS